jgi:hypothetical protein
LVFKPGAELGDPCVQRLRLLLQDDVFGLASVGGLEPEVVVMVSPV